MTRKGYHQREHKRTNPKTRVKFSAGRSRTKKKTKTRVKQTITHTPKGRGNAGYGGVRRRQVIQVRRIKAKPVDRESMRKKALEHLEKCYNPPTRPFIEVDTEWIEPKHYPPRRIKKFIRGSPRRNGRCIPNQLKKSKLQIGRYDPRREKVFQL